MYKLIVVDDEAIIRDGISMVVPWGDNGFELAGLFENGIDALEFIRDNPVDLIISDINMPRMNGLELSRRISTNFPDIPVLLLTGYDEFEYAQEAVRNQVRDFLLKPITAEELSHILARMYRELEAVRYEKQQQEVLQDKLERSFPLLRERYLQRLVTARIPEHDFIRQKEYFNWIDRKSLYRIAAIGMPESWDEVDRLALAERSLRKLSNADEQFTNPEDFLILLLQDESKVALEERSAKLSGDLFRSVSRSGKDDISIGLGEFVESLDAIAISYHSAINAVHYARLLGLSQVLSSAEARSRERLSLDDFNTLVEALITNLKNAGKEESQAALNAIFHYLETHYISPEQIDYYFAFLHSAIFSFVKNMDMAEPADALLPFRRDPFESLLHAKDFFMTTLGSIEDLIRSRREDLVNSRIYRAKVIISESYREPDFSLQDICDELFLSVSQFSVLFKEGTGKTFVEYLTDYRIEKAKELLKKTDFRTYEIAEAVGYSDPRYFSYVFKKATNMTTREYQRSVLA